MEKWLNVLLAVTVIGLGVKTVWQRHAELPTLRDMADDLSDGERGWEAYGWLAILIGCLEVALGLWWLGLALHF